MDSVLDAQVVTGDTFSSTCASASLSILDGGGGQLFNQSEQCFSTASCPDAGYHGSGVSLSIAPNTPYEVILNVSGTTSGNNSFIQAYADPHFSRDSAFSGAGEPRLPPRLLPSLYVSKNLRMRFSNCV